jgi:1-acyl-sn-glycerol-3-phosphate acyltransferase
VAWLALASGAPVVPVAVIGTDRIQPVGARFPRPGRVTVRFGAPLRFAAPAGNAARARRTATDEIMAEIEKLSGQENAGCYNELSTGQ